MHLKNSTLSYCQGYYQGTENCFKKFNINELMTSFYLFFYCKRKPLHNAKTKVSISVAHLAFLKLQ